MKPPSGVIGVEGLEVQRVAAVDPESGHISEVTPANLHVYEFDWSPDSTEAGLHRRAAARREQLVDREALHGEPIERSPMAAAPVSTSHQPASPSLFDPNVTSGPLHGLQLAVPRWSPNGSQIGFISGLMSDQGSTGGDIYVIPSTGGDPKDVTPDRACQPGMVRVARRTSAGHRRNQGRVLAPLRL